MSFFLTTLNLARFLTKNSPTLSEEKTNIQVVNTIDAWKHSSFLCKNYILNGLDDSLYNRYRKVRTTK